MPATVKLAIVIVPGSWHVPSHYNLLHNSLGAAGYKVTTCDLPSTGASVPHTDISQDVFAIRKDITAYLDSDVNVVLVMHSFGGFVGTCAVEGLLPHDSTNGKGVTSLVYICAGVPRKGFSLYGASGGQHAPFIRVHGEPGTGVFMSPDNTPHDPRDLFYHDCAPEVREEAIGQLKLSSESVLHSPATYEAWKEVESNYLVCELDQALPPRMQEMMTGMEGGKWKRVARLKTGHSPCLSKPEETADFVRRCAGEDL